MDFNLRFVSRVFILNIDSCDFKINSSKYYKSYILRFFISIEFSFVSNSEKNNIVLSVCLHSYSSVYSGNKYSSFSKLKFQKNNYLSRSFCINKSQCLFQCWRSTEQVVEATTTKFGTVYFGCWRCASEPFLFKF